MNTGLPIDSALPTLRATLARATRAVLQAPPGAGKSTVVPLALLDTTWMCGKKLVMLEPRRLAARAVATRMSHLLGEAVGRTVGYRMRLDTRVSAATRIEVVTEGVLTRMLQSDPALEGVAAVVFDEFHERHLPADLGLALALDAQANLAPELRVLVMSATLDTAAIAQLLGNAPVVAAEGRVFPVATHYLGSAMPALPGDLEPPERAVVRAIKQAVRDTRGDMLVFLPGAAEIRRVQSMLESDDSLALLRVLPLYGELGAREQDAALACAPAGMRKCVLATNIAETSLTIDGITVVIDSGLVRRAVFDPASGMSRLETRRISRASADQRQGRAGRTAPGVCYRLWSEGAQRSLAAFTPPEIVEADLATLALDLAAWGTSEQDLSWLDPPPSAMLASARALLRSLGALDTQGLLTSHGRAMSELAMHPRLAHLLLVAEERGLRTEAAWLAALLSERDVLRPPRLLSTGRGAPPRDADIRSRVDALQGHATAGWQLDRSALERVRRGARALLGGGTSDVDTDGPPRKLHDVVGLLLASAYPDRIGLRRDGAQARYQLTNGRGAYFDGAESIAREEFIVAIDLDDRDREARIRLAAPIHRAELLEWAGARLEIRDEVRWDAREEAVISRRVALLDALLVEERPLARASPEAMRSAMLDGIRALGLDSLPWNVEARALQARIQFVAGLGRGDLGAWPRVDDASLLADLSWLAPYLDGVSRRSQLARLRLTEALRARLDYSQQRKLEELAPSHIGLPTGSRARIDYEDENAPCASMRIQEVFGLAETPRIGGGAIPVTFKLLSPAQRPLQITRDLASFWRDAYVEVRKEMRGRYPRHYWPEDPLQAEPTRRAKPRS